VARIVGWSLLTLVLVYNVVRNIELTIHRWGAEKFEGGRIGLGDEWFEIAFIAVLVALAALSGRLLYRGVSRR
jgi:hypothetical protein